MLDSAPPFEQTPPVNVLPTIRTGWPWYWLSTRSAAPPRSGPVGSHRLPTNRRADHREPAAADEDRAAPAALGQVAGRVAVGEREVLHDQLGRLLVLAVRGRVALLLVAGVLVEDPALAAAGQRDLPAAVEDRARVRVDDLRGLGHRDRHRSRAAVERDHPAGRDRGDDRGRGAAGRGAGADDAVRVRGVDAAGVDRRGRRRRFGPRSCAPPGRASRRTAAAGPAAATWSGRASARCWPAPARRPGRPPGWPGSRRPRAPQCRPGRPRADRPAASAPRDASTHRREHPSRPRPVTGRSRCSRIGQGSAATRSATGRRRPV